MKILRPLLLVLGLLVLALAAVALWPAPRVVYVLRQDPAPDFAAAEQRLGALATPDAVRPECAPLALTHGRRTRDAYVLLHGLTNCPAQFRVLAGQLHADGASVVVPRLPRHGFTDRMTPELATVTAQELLDNANEAIDLARGLGDRVIVIGLSVSGVTAAWLAQMRGDLDLVVCIAPFLAPVGVPDAALAPLTNLLLRAPNVFVWWDAELKENPPGSPFSYPRFPTHLIGQTLRLGLDLFARAARTPPRAPRILLVTSPDDPAISLPRVAELAALWKTRAVSREFPADWRVPHDAIDPAQPTQQIARVYPQLRAWIAEALPPP